MSCQNLFRASSVGYFVKSYFTPCCFISLQSFYIKIFTRYYPGHFFKLVSFFPCHSRTYTKLKLLENKIHLKLPLKIPSYSNGSKLDGVQPVTKTNNNIIYFLKFRPRSTAGENIEIRVFNHDYRATINEVLHALHRANLELRGFIKSVIKKSITIGSENPVYSTVLHFDKTVPCDQLMFVEQEIQSLLPEVWGEEISKRVVSTVSHALINGGKICTAGIEIHLPPHGGCTGRNAKRNVCDSWCMLCFHGTVMAL